MSVATKVTDYPVKTHSLDVKFFVGLHSLALPGRGDFDLSFISYNRLKRRVSNFEVNKWVMDSGAFTEVTKHGGFRTSPEEYVKAINRWSTCGELLAAVSQDYMCETRALNSTGGTIIGHQLKTVDRYEKIVSLQPQTYIMPILQGYEPEEYARCVEMYGDLLKKNMWVGVGSVCKRNSNAGTILDVLQAIKGERPDLRLHGFGLKKTALEDKQVRSLLHSSDSMAWSYNARYAQPKRNANCWREAKAYELAIKRQQHRIISLHEYEN